MKINLKDLTSEFSDNLMLDYDLKKKNWFNIGGKTKAFFKADSLKELIKFPKKIQNPKRIRENPGFPRDPCGDPCCLCGLCP